MSFREIDRTVLSAAGRKLCQSSWAQGGLQYRLVTDVAAPEADQLVALLRAI